MGIFAAKSSDVFKSISHMKLLQIICDANITISCIFPVCLEIFPVPIYKSFINWHRENLQADRENTVNLQIGFE